MKFKKLVKANWNDVTVDELKGILEDCISILEDFDGNKKCKVHPNTYGIGDPFISISSKGFIELRDPVSEYDDEDEEVDE